MFGFGFSKLAVLIGIVIAVWYGFKFVGQLDKARKQARANKPPRQSGGGGGSAPEVEDKSIVPSSTSPLEVDEFIPKQTEEEIMAAIVRNACLRRCPSGSVPVYIGEDVTGFFNFETAHLTNFSEGVRLNL